MKQKNTLKTKQHDKLNFRLISYCTYCLGYCTAIPLDANFEPLEPQKTLKDLYNDIVNWFEGLNDHLALSLLIVLFFSLVYLVNHIIFNIN